MTKVYPNGKHAIEDIDLDVPEGDFVFLVGPSGAGKSTLIKLLVRDEVPTNGSVSVAGFDLDTIKRADVPSSGGASASCSRTSGCCPARPCARTSHSPSR